jgi:hypothetical protein
MKWEAVREIARRLPGVEDSSYHGYPALRVAGKFLVRLGDDRDSLEFKALDPNERELLLESASHLYFLPPRFHGAGVFVHLKPLDRKTARALLERHWRAAAPKALAKAFDARRNRR